MRFGLLSAIVIVVIHAQRVRADKRADDRPNILFIMTDDQDARLGSVDYMPNVQKLLVQQGTSYLNHYVTSAVCCPSRVSLLRGQYAHNTNITHVYPPYGGYSRYAELGLGKQTLPVWLQQAGYSTNYVGKLMNDIHLHNYNTPAPQGFDYQEQLLDPYTYVYDVAVLSKNGERPVVYKHYQTDVLHAKALNVLRRQRDASKPFFLMVAPMAPHGQVRLDIYDKDIAITEPPTPAARHAHLFKDAKVPRTPNFNPETPTRTANFWKFLPHANETRVKTFDDVHRARLQSLQAVDEMVASLVAELEHQGKLENTYIFYTSDNGYHIGQHRAYPGKSASIEEDINVPFIVRGPGIAHGETSRLLSAHHDLAPTFLALAKGSRFVPAGIDGGVIPLTEELRQQPKQAAKEAFAVEFWFDLQRPEGGLVWTEPYEGVNTYKSVRVISEKHNYKYTVWCSGEREFFDLNQDPFEVNNGYAVLDTRLATRLNALLAILKTCRAATCRDPWRDLHPDNPGIQSLHDALDPAHDDFYAQFQRVTFNECLPFQSESNEWPLKGLPFLDNVTMTAETNEKSESGACHARRMLELPENQQQQPWTAPKTPGTHSERSSDHTAQQVYDLFRLVRGDGPLSGRQMVPDDFEDAAEPIPQALLDANVDWVNYGFYSSFGN